MDRKVIKDNYHSPVQKRLKNLFRRAARMRGDHREDLVSQALEMLKTQGLIISHYTTERFGREDQGGIDKIFFRLDGEKEKFQVKGSTTGALEHGAKHPHIPCLVVKDGASPEQIAKLIAKKFKLSKSP